MSFPFNPQNNQVAVINNITYLYNQASNKWTRTNPTVGYMVSYLQVYNQTDRPGLATSSDLVFDLPGSGSGIGYSNVTGVFTLSGEKTYELYAAPRLTNLTGSYVQYEWVDATTNTPLATSGFAVGTTNNTTTGDTYIATLIYTPSTTQTVKVRITGADGTATLKGSSGSYAKVTQIGVSGLASDVIIGGGSRSTSTSTGGLVVKGGAGVSGNLYVGGSVVKSGYTPGEVIKVTMVSYNSINQIPVTLCISTDFTTIATYSYTPVSASSYFLVEYISSYTVSTGGADTFVSRITVANGEITYGSQTWLGITSGTGTRSGVLFPLMGRFTNSSTAAKPIVVAIKRTTGDATVTVLGDNSTWLKITEIGR
jgi:hypothetical protein